MLVGVWVPLRVLYFGDHHPLDLMVELFTLGLVLAHYNFKMRSKDLSDDERKTSKAALVTDILVAFPFVVLLAPFAGLWTSHLLLIKILLLKRLTYVPDLLDAFATLHPIVYRLVPVFVLLPMLVHLTACLWIGMGSGTAGPNPDSVTEYIKAIYWTITTLTTVGYGDISAKTNGQMLLTCGVEITGVGVFGYILSNVAAILTRLDAARDHHLTELDRVETYMNYNHLSPELRSRVRAYYRYLWDSHRGYDDNEVLTTLPAKLHADIALELNQKIITQVPLLTGAQEDVIQDIVMELRPIVSVPGEKIFHIDEPGESMYFIHSGEVDIIARNGTSLATLKPGSFFGEMALITNQGRNATAKAKTYCDLFVLSREAFERVAHRYPTFEQVVHQTAQSRKAA